MQCVFAIELIPKLSQANRVKSKFTPFGIQVYVSGSDRCLSSDQIEDERCDLLLQSARVAARVTCIAPLEIRSLFRVRRSALGDTILYFQLMAKCASLAADHRNLRTLRSDR